MHNRFCAGSAFDTFDPCRAGSQDALPWDPEVLVGQLVVLEVAWQPGSEAEHFKCSPPAVHQGLRFHYAGQPPVGTKCQLATRGRKSVVKRQPVLCPRSTANHSSHCLRQASTTSRAPSTTCSSNLGKPPERSPEVNSA